MYHVYLLKCKDGSIYTGITTDIKRRLEQHKNGTGGRYTHSKGAVRILYSEKSKNRSIATKREMEIKKMTRLQKLKLIKENA